MLKYLFTGIRQNTYHDIFLWKKFRSTVQHKFFLDYFCEIFNMAGFQKYLSNLLSGAILRIITELETSHRRISLEYRRVKESHRWVNKRTDESQRRIYEVQTNYKSQMGYRRTFTFLGGLEKIVYRQVREE